MSETPPDLGAILASGPDPDVPMQLRALHRAGSDGQQYRFKAHDAASWPDDLLTAVLDGEGFARTATGAERVFTLPDSVGPNMEVLLVGLNPSPPAAESGVGFAGPTNRFWKAALAAKLVSEDRDPISALEHNRVGMTDLVKRVTVSAKELTAAEYRNGLERLELLSDWLRPNLVCFVGLSGWRVAVNRSAKVGHQREQLGGRPVFVMPNPSGLNAHVTTDDLADYFRTVRDFAST